MVTREAAILLRRLFLIFALAAISNYVWELAQTPLYEGVELPAAFWHCFVAALGDGLLVLILFVVVAAVMRSHDWYLRPGAASYVAMAIAGLAVGFAVEWWGLHIARRWQYSDLMPMVPWADVGAAPVLQMLLLPPAIFAVARKLRDRAAASR
ncbi:MAG: hypothetical protein WAO95_07460 [Burkholderiales bacterium]